MPEDKACPNQSLPISEQTGEEQRHAVPRVLSTGRQPERGPYHLHQRQGTQSDGGSVRNAFRLNLERHSQPVRAIIELERSTNSFPNNSTLNTNLSATQINLLANRTAWSTYGCYATDADTQTEANRLAALEAKLQDGRRIVAACRSAPMTIKPHADTSEASPGQSDRRERLIRIYDELDDAGKLELLRLAEELSRPR